ncbi:hypothetical protein ABT337_31385 [Saccharopolyspora hirsuta]|uniref:DUF3558 domain-containing protein n=1 Tax=Saccharopolyspora hirsuta TaxID=1837 RepID=A0A5M7BTC8_SACHI|nr:hypothetical protein [Saccharopolyspora hirsuta]KAA5833476.1 hypothetical protein F1721_14420 [Saccharopolyspora hirsuta]
MQPQQPGQWGPQNQQVPPGPQFQQWQQVPRKKSRAGCITLVVIGIVVLLGVGIVVGGYFYWRHGIINTPAGEEPSGENVISPCDLVSEETLRQLRTTNLIHGYESEDGSSASCTWRPTKGQDGNNERYLDITVSRAVSSDPEEAVAEAEETLENYRQTDGKRAARVVDVEGPWDEAFLATGTEVKQALLVFRKGTTTVSVGYDGYDKTYWFEDERMPAADAERNAKAAAEEFAAGI